MLKLKYTDEYFKEKQRQIEDLGARANAIVNSIKRPPSEINHLKYEYKNDGHQIMNGQTDGVKVKQDFFDGVTQKLTVVFGKFGYNPCHIHPHYSVCKVVLGAIYDSVNGKRYEKGDWYYTPKGQPHSAQSIGHSVVELYNTNSEIIAKEIFESHRYKKFDRLIMKEWQ